MYNFANLNNIYRENFDIQAQKMTKIIKANKYKLKLQKTQCFWNLWNTSVSSSILWDNVTFQSVACFVGEIRKITPN